MRKYENILKTSENRLPQRSYYIPAGKSDYKLLNGDWRFAYFSRDIDVPEKIEKWDTVPVPSCWQALGYENPFARFVLTAQLGFGEGPENFNSGV